MPVSLGNVLCFSCIGRAGSSSIWAYWAVYSDDPASLERHGAICGAGGDGVGLFRDDVRRAASKSR